MSIVLSLVAILICYIVGAIPTGLLVGKYLGGINVLEHGSKNIGMTNVWRLLGWKLGMLTLVIDAGKAYLVVAFAPQIAGGAGFPYLMVWCALGALMGNFFNVFLNWKGGKGIATSLGVFLALAPIPILLALAGFLVMLGLTRYVSVGSITGALVLGSTAFVFADLPTAIVTAVISIIAIWKHKANIQRLMNGTENKVGKKKA